MTKRDLRDTRDAVRLLPASVAGDRAVDWGRGVAATVVLGPHPRGRLLPDEDERAATSLSGPWVVILALLTVSVILGGGSHLGGRGGRLEPETGAWLALASAALAVALAALLRSRFATLPHPVRLSLRTAVVIGIVLWPVGAALSLWRLASGETNETILMIGAAIGLAVGVTALGLMARDLPRPLQHPVRPGLSQQAVRRLRERDLEQAERLRRAERAALTALVDTGRISTALFREHADRWARRWARPEDGDARA